MNNQIERNCPSCGVTYLADPKRLKHGRQTTCSRTCSYNLRAAQLTKREDCKCGVCGTIFERSPAQIKSKHGVVFCSRECAYKLRKRTVVVPYARARPYDRSAAAAKAWFTRRLEAKPYPDAARIKARANLIKNLEQLGGVSKFERKAAKMLASLGHSVMVSVPVRRANGQYATVFDIMLPALNLVIECHGTYWHGGRWTWETPNAAQARNLAYEAGKLTIARREGVDLRILWEHEFKKDPIGALLTVIR